ncbi:MAG: AAA-like domain-containing protein, partial [Bdellovibrionales bacterium]
MTSQRLSLNLEANAEYDRHLRHLLRSTNRRFIIILDEIDSLVGTAYSDIILAQIRSMYFSRASYPEYKKLTYVLSGVVEPADLIKDKNISPFNIGEKIYLEDFSRSEFDLFLKKTDLAENSAISDAIFSWASGNPRMTWDICSELEELIFSGAIVTKETVDQVVEKLYLTNFDRPPIDHIRTLVETDSQIQNAIVSLHYGKTAHLDDRTKNRLYLSGITQSAAGASVQIKNRIIDEALSDRWLSQVSVDPTAALKSASVSFKDREFVNAVQLFEDAFIDKSVNELAPPNVRFEFALSYFHTGNMLRATEELRKCLTQSSEPSNLQNINYFLGLTHMSQGDYQQAVNFLESAASGPDNSVQVTAKLSLMQAFLNADSTQYGIDALTCGYKLIEDIKCQEPKFEDADYEYLVAAIYNVALAHAALGDLSSAENELKNALLIAKPEWQNTILLSQYDVTKDDISRKQIALQLAEVIINNKLNITKNSIESLQFDENKFALSLMIINKHSLEEKFNELIKYAANHVYAGRMSYSAEIILHLYESLRSSKGKTFHISILEKAINDLEETPSITVLKILRALAHNSSESKKEFWRSKYINYLRSNIPDESKNEEDLELLVSISFAWLNARNYPKLKLLFDTSRAMAAQASSNLVFFTYLNYCEMEFCNLEHRKRDASKVAENLLSLLDKLDEADDSSMTELDKMPTEMRNRALSFLIRMPIRHVELAKFSRNQKVKV